MTKHKNIEEALKSDRPNDKVVRIINNKFALVQSAFTNGQFDDTSLCGLDNGTIYFYGKTDNRYTAINKEFRAGWYSLKRYAEQVMQMPNTEVKMIGYHNEPIYRFKTQNNRHYKQAYRKILKLNIF